jgi:hypothetical protein
MRRIKILKIFFVVMLFIVFTVYANFSLIYTFFMSTLTFNIAISTMFLIGLLVVYQSAIRLTMLAGTFGILAFKTGKNLEFYLEGISGLMPATIAHMFHRRAKKGVLFFTQQEAKEVIEWLESQFFQQKGYTAFFVGTSLMLGLFGTFTGLLVAIDEMGGIILSFGGDNIDIGEIMTGFSGPLGGMAIGFASSLFGVASAIILNVLQYILTRNQSAFVDDVQDWMKGKIIESQSGTIDQVESIDDFSNIKTTQIMDNSSPMSTGFIDIFVDTMGDFTDKMERSNQVSQDMFMKIADKLDHSIHKTDNESILLKNMIEIMKESNVNQYSNAKLIEESLQEISSVILSEHKTIKKSLQIQEDNNKLLLQLLEILTKNNLENKR